MYSPISAIDEQGILQNNSLILKPLLPNAPWIPMSYIISVSSVTLPCIAGPLE